MYEANFGEVHGEKKEFCYGVYRFSRFVWDIYPPQLENTNGNSD